MIQNFENIFEVVLLVGEASSFNSATLIKTNSCIDIFEAFDNTFRTVSMYFSEHVAVTLSAPVKELSIELVAPETIAVKIWCI